MLDAFVPRLVEYGWPGIFVVFLIWLLVKRDQIIDQQAKLINDLNEKRITEALKSADALRESSDVVESSASVLKLVSYQLEKRDQQRG
jgi:hypothetical protein